MKRDQALTRLAPARRDRIVFMASTLPVGGAEICLLDLMKGSGSLGFEPHLLLLKEPGPLGERVIADGSVRVVHGLKKRGITPGLLRRIYTELRRIDPKTLITLEHDDVMLAGRIAAWLARVPRVVTMMHTTNRRDGTPTVTALFRLMKRFSDIYVSPAHGHRDHLAAQGLPSPACRWRAGWRRRDHRPDPAPCATTDRRSPGRRRSGRTPATGGYAPSRLRR